MIQDFVVRHVGTETHFAPGPKSVRDSLAVFGLGLVAALIVPLVLPHMSRDVPQAIRLLWLIGGLGIAVLLAGIGFWAWQMLAIPLVVDARTGEIRYGTAVVCEPGTVEAVLVRTSLDEGQRICAVAFFLHSGDVKTIPSPWFASIGFTVGRETAGTIAGLLDVNVVEKT